MKKKQSKTKQNWNTFRNTFPRKRYEILKKLITEIFDTSIHNDKPLQIILLVSLLFHTIIANLSLKQRNLSQKISFRSLLYVENTFVLSQFKLENNIWICNFKKKDTPIHCVKSVQIRSFFWNAGNTDQKKLRVWTLFM